MRWDVIMSSIKHGIVNGVSKDDFSDLAGEKPTELASMVDSLVNQYVQIWWKLCRKPSVRTGEATDFMTKRRKQARTDEFIDSFINKIKSYPSEQNSRAQWKSEINRLMEDFFSKIEYIQLDEIQFLLSGGILEATEVFVKDARDFDQQIKFEDIGQAMRNVWIMNISQILLNQPVRCTPSVFAYSMLYPFTDNYIDNAELDIECKKSYSSRFERRLAGEHIESQNDYEAKIFTLVEFIEKEYARADFPYVYDSLLRIHKAQSKSILQHNKGTTPYDADILGVSFEKGGASVLADAFLVKGTLKPMEIDFFFAYGLMLQLCDDLQDIKEDLKNNHHTIFSLTAKRWPIDHITDALFNIVDYVAELIDGLDVADPLLFKNIIRRNCCFLVYFAIVKNKEFYSKAYFNNVKPYLPYNPYYMNNFYKKLSEKYKKLKPSYNGISTETILLEALK